MSYTKGPWYVRKWDGEYWPENRYSVGPQSEDFATAVAISPRYYNGGNVGANMTLIAAAPELLEALELAHQHMALHIKSYNEGWNVYECVRLAIVKAKGGIE